MPLTREIPPLLTAREVADALRLDVSSVYRMARAGELRSIRTSGRPGSSLRVPATELARILEPINQEKE
jgi:excisionase family DNA binding protein